MGSADSIRQDILRLAREYCQVKFGKPAFCPGNDLVHYAGRVFDSAEMCNLIDSSLDFFLTAGRYSEEFESAFEYELTTDQTRAIALRLRECGESGRSSSTGLRSLPGGGVR